MLFPLILGFLLGCSGSKREIVVGTKDYTEQYILGNILSMLIESNTDISVSLKTDLSSEVIFSAIRTEVVDVYVDYTGTIYGMHLVNSETKSSDEIYSITKTALSENFDLLMLDPLGFNNSYCLAVSRDFADSHGLMAISDLAEISENFVIGGGFEFLIRKDGLPNLKILYNMNFRSESILDGIDRYIAIENDEIQVMGAFSTDGHLLWHDMVVLDDDKNFFYPYQGAIIISSKAAEEFPELIDLFSQLTGLLTDMEMRNLNYRVDVHNETPQDVAELFLIQNNLINR